MNVRIVRLAAIVAALTQIVLGYSNATAQPATADPEQVLDRVTATGRDFALDLRADDPDRLHDFSVLLEAGALPAETNLVDCTTSVTDGLFCIDGKSVVNWPDIEDASSASTVFSCENAALDLDEKKDDTCTALARNSQKVIFLGGKQNGKSNLVGVVRFATFDEQAAMQCQSGYDYFTDAGNGLCFAPLAEGRPLIQDMDVIEGDLALEFAGEEVLLVLEERKTLLKYSGIDPQNGPTVTAIIASGKSDWNLIGNEQLLNSALLPVGAVFFGLAATTSGRILAVNTEGEPSAFGVFDFNDHRMEANGQAAQPCVASGDDDFDVTVSDKTGLIYASDRNYCLVHVLKAQPNGSSFTLELAEEGVPGMMTPLTLSTNDAGGLGTFPPLLVAVTPGISVDLGQCGVECAPVTASNGQPGLLLRDVTLSAFSETSMTLFQVTGYPDCRWIPDVCAALFPDYNAGEIDAVTFLKGKNVIVDVDPVGLPEGPAYQLLNLEVLLPAEIKALYPSGLPPLLMERENRGAAQNGYYFDAFFGSTPEGVNFVGAHELEINVQALLSGSGTGNALGCFLGLPENSPLYTDGSSLGTLNWDVVASVSEDQTTYTSDPLSATSTGDRRPYAPSGQPNFETRLINFDCTNPPRSKKGTWSMVSYGLEVTPCTAMRNADDTGWILEGVCSVGEAPFVEKDHAVLAKLLLKQYKDFRDALNELACVANEEIDGLGALAPIDSATCGSLDETWVNGLDKLIKGLEATLAPKTSQGAENFGAFESKLEQLLLTVQGIPPDPSRPDFANRKGDLEARLLTIGHVYEDRFLPSITEAGFGGDGDWVH
jgi:hypothetical protein